MVFRVSRILVILSVVVAAALISTQSKAEQMSDYSGGKSILLNTQNPMNTLKSMSLLDPERFTMRNQYMMSFSSVSGNGSLMGMYINTMEYRFNCPLIMRLKVAYQSQTGRLFGDKNAFTGNPSMQDGRLFIPSFDLIYQPFKNTTISFHFRDYTNNSYYGYGGYGYSRYNRMYGMSPYNMW